MKIGGIGHVVILLQLLASYTTYNEQEFQRYCAELGRQDGHPKCIDYCSS